jgi:hypothetical protein
MKERCFACGRPLDKWEQVTTMDGQLVYVGMECYRKIKRGIRDMKTYKGYQPPRGGPRLYGIGAKG